MSIKLLTKQRLELLSLTGGCTGPSESTLVKMPHCWKSHVTAHISYIKVHMGLNMRNLPLVFVNNKCADQHAHPRKLISTFVIGLLECIISELAITGLLRSGKKFWKIKNVPGQGKVREFHFQSGKFRKNEKSHRKVREFKKFQKKMLVNWLLVFHKLQAILEKECFLT